MTEENIKELFWFIGLVAMIILLGGALEAATYTPAECTLHGMWFEDVAIMIITGVPSEIITEMWIANWPDAQQDAIPHMLEWIIQMFEVGHMPDTIGRAVTETCMKDAANV